MTLGEQFATAFAAKDAEALKGLFAPDVDFKGLTPRRIWEAGSADEVLDILFGNWVEDHDQVTALVSVREGDDVEDTHHVGYRMAITTPDGPFTMEQQLYYREGDGRLAYMRVLCSGFRRVS